MLPHSMRPGVLIPLMAWAPKSMAVKLDKEPWNMPTGVLAADTMYIGGSSGMVDLCSCCRNVWLGSVNKRK